MGAAAPTGLLTSYDNSFVADAYLRAQFICSLVYQLSSLCPIPLLQSQLQDAVLEGGPHLVGVHAAQKDALGIAVAGANLAIAGEGFDCAVVIGDVSDYLLWYAKNIPSIKYRGLFETRSCNLAEGSKNAAAQVKSIIADIQKAMRAAVEVTGHTIGSSAKSWTVVPPSVMVTSALAMT